jgi:hypothetical protein
MLSNDELISAIFYLAGGRIKGLTRLQMTVFLVKRVLGIGMFDFEMRKYSPWSHELERTIEGFEYRGLLRTSITRPDLASVLFGESPVRVYEASQDLIRDGEDVLRKLERSDVARALYLRRLVRAALIAPLSYLIATSIRRSDISEKVEKWKRSKFLAMSRV